MGKEGTYCKDHVINECDQIIALQKIYFFCFLVGVGWKGQEKKQSQLHLFPLQAVDIL